MSERCLIIEMGAYHRGVVVGMNQALALMEKFGLENHAAVQLLQSRIRERGAAALLDGESDA